MKQTLLITCLILFALPSLGETLIMKCGSWTAKSKSNFFSNPTYYHYNTKYNKWDIYEGSEVGGWDNHSVICESRKTSVICNHKGYQGGKLMTSKEIVDFKRERFFMIFESGKKIEFSSKCTVFEE